MKTQFLLFAILSFAIAMIENINAFGQASLAAENVIDDIKVTTKFGEQKMYTVFRDARTRNQWYYLPNELRIAETVDAKGNVRPKMNLLRYKYTDAVTKESKDGGVLVAAFTYAMEPEVVIQVKDYIKSKKNVADINLSAMPLNTSTMDFLSDAGEFVGNVDAKPVSGPTSASQEMVISYNLTTLGTSVLRSLANSTGGIPIRGYISYNSLSPPCGYTIRGNWDNVYKYFEQNKLYEGRFNFWVVSGGGSYSKNRVKESLENMQGIEVEQIECDSASSAADDANRESLIKFIQNEVFTQDMLSKTAELAKLQSLLKGSDSSAAKKIADLIKTAKGSIQFGYQNSIKDIQKRRKGEINYNFAKQKVINRFSTVGGLLSFKKYQLTPEKLVEQGYIIDVDANEDFPCVIIKLPNIYPDLQLRTMSFEISFTNSQGRSYTEARSWNAEKGWVTPTDVPMGYIRFNLLGEYNKKKLEEPEFEMTAKVVSMIPNASFEIKKKITTKVGTADKVIELSEFMFKEITVDGTQLHFAQLTNDPADLAYAKLTLTKGQIKINKDIKPYFTDNVPGPPSVIRLLLPNDDTPESSKVIFVKNNGERIERSDQIEGETTLLNSEWRRGN